MEFPKNDVFQNEYRILENAANVINSSEFTNNSLCSHFKELFVNYKKLLQQSSSLVRISDKQQDHLHKLQSDLKNVLDNTGQGILTVNENLIINKDYSDECSSIFNNDIEGLKFTDIIRPFNNIENINVLEAVLNEDYFNGDALQRKVLLMLLPKEIYISNNIYKIQYRPVTFNFKDILNNAFMIILTDITEKKVMEKALEKEKTVFKSVTRIVSDIRSFSNCVKEYKSFYKENLPKLILDSKRNLKDLVEEIVREVHTLKGNLSIFELTSLICFLEQIELSLVLIKKNLNNVNKSEVLEIIYGFDFDGELSKTLNEISSVIGKTWVFDSDFAVVSLNEFKDIEKEALSISENLYKKIHTLRLTDFCDSLKIYPEYTLRMANRLEKDIGEFSIECNEKIKIDCDMYDSFTSSLIHIFRNIVDHGIETQDQRMNVGKSPEGKIAFCVSTEGNFIKIVISDDGSGIDLNSVKQKALKDCVVTDKQALSMSDEEILELVFLDGITTSDDNCQFSGRGVGLSAVKYQTELLGGKIKVKSKLGEGTTFEFYIPYEK